MRYIIGMSIGILVMVACGSAPFSVTEYILDVKDQALRASKPKYDKPISFCDEHICYVYENEDIKKIKKYVIEIETRLKSCEKHNNK